MTSKLYKSHPIENDKREIRLVCLMPGFWDDPISCTLKVASLNDAPRYDTLSYAWGDPENTESILLDGRYVEVTINLGSALRHLRNQMEHRILWVDALCIDQKDRQEKSWQVSMMGEIYKSCNTGLLWIGEKSEDSDAWCEAKTYGHCHKDIHRAPSGLPEEAERYGPRLDSQQKVHRKCRWHGRRPRMLDGFALLEILANDTHLNEIPGFVRLTSPSNLDEPRFVEPIQAIGAMFRRAWWHRMWTVQEAVLPLSTTIVCGSIKVSWDVLMKACWNLRKHRNSCCHLIYKEITRLLQFPTHGLSTFQILHRFQREMYVLEDTRSKVSNPRHMDFFQLSRRFGAREAGDERDRVYALLGLFQSQARSLSADYNLSVEELHLELSRALLTSGHLAVMYGDRRGTDTELYPSWARRFGRAIDRFEREYEGIRDQNRKSYDASGSRDPSVQILSARTVSLAGIKLSEVAEMSSSFQDYHNLDETLRTYLCDCSALINFAARKNTAYKAGGTLKEAYLRAAVGDRYRSSDAEVSREPETKELQTLKEWIFSLRPISSQTQSVLASNIGFHVLQRRFFTTKSGLVGFGPSNLLPGDEVWIIFGSRVPFIARRLDGTSGAVAPSSGVESQDSHQRCIIGDCYVQGIMQGEAVEGGKETRIFVS